MNPMNSPPSPPIRDKGSTDDRILPLGAIAILPALITFLFYLPSLNNSFVNWDDPENILNNPHIRSLSLDSIGWMFTNFYQAFWIPLNWLSLALDYSLGHLDPVTYHFHNLSLHCLNTLLVFFVSRKIFLVASSSPDTADPKASWPQSAAFLTALLFGLHPIHVESVVWVTERKDLLGGFYCLLSLGAYLEHVTRPDGKKWRYFLSLAFFILSLLCKPMAMTLPLVFMLLDHWPLRRIKIFSAHGLQEKVPFFILAFCAGGISLLAQSHFGMVPNFDQLPLSYRIMNAFHSLVFYLVKIFVPIRLAALYPIVLLKTYSLEYLVYLWAVLMISLATFLNRRTRPYLAVAWLIYIVTLSPVLGIQYVGIQCAADHFTYLPSLAPFMLLSSALAVILSNRRAFFGFLCVVLSVSMGITTAYQSMTWKNSVNLWERVIKVASPYIYDFIYEHLGDAYTAESRWDEASRAYYSALALSPFKPGLHEKRGIVLINQNLPAEAAKEFEQEVSFDPKNPMAHRYLYFAYQKIGKSTEALAEVQKAIEIDPKLPGVYNSLGASYFSMKKYDLAVGAFEKAHEMDPQNLDCLMNLAAAYTFSGKPEGSIQALKMALAIQSQDPNIYQKLGEAYEKLGDQESANQAFAAANSMGKKE